MYYDNNDKSEYMATENQGSEQKVGASLMFDLDQGRLHDDDFTIGISVVFLQFSAPSSGSVRVTIDRDYFGRKYNDEEVNDSHNRSIVYISQNISLPEERIEERNIIRSYDQAS